MLVPGCIALLSSWKQKVCRTGARRRQNAATVAADDNGGRNYTIRSRYSLRIARIGSMRKARSVGSNVPTSAITAVSAIAPA